MELTLGWGRELLPSVQRDLCAKQCVGGTEAVEPVCGVWRSAVPTGQWLGSLGAALLPRGSAHPADRGLESWALGVSPPWPMRDALGVRLALGDPVLVGVGGTHWLRSLAHRHQPAGDSSGLRPACCAFSDRELHCGLWSANAGLCGVIRSAKGPQHEQLRGL